MCSCIQFILQFPSSFFFPLNRSSSREREKVVVSILECRFGTCDTVSFILIHASQRIYNNSTARHSYHLFRYWSVFKTFENSCCWCENNDTNLPAWSHTHIVWPSTAQHNKQFYFLPSVLHPIGIFSNSLAVFFVSLFCWLDNSAAHSVTIVAIPFHFIAEGI